MLPVSLLVVGFGLLIGSVFTSDGQISGFVTLFLNATVFLGGIVVSLSHVGGVFERICYLLPFANAVTALRNATAGKYGSVFVPLLIVSAYAALLFTASAQAFQRRVKA